MALYGVLKKSNNETVYSYVYNRMKSLGTPYHTSDYVQYEIEEGHIAAEYIWDNETSSVVIDPNYVAPEPDQEKIVRSIVEAAIEYGNSLILDFATENVLMGITQAGKTKDVADYLQNVDRYARSGSLYEVAAEIDRLIAEGLPVELEPFITETRLLEFKQKVLDHLGS